MRGIAHIIVTTVITSGGALFSSRCPFMANFCNVMVPKNFRTFYAVPYYSIIIIIYVRLFILRWMGNLLSLHLRSK